MTLQRQVGIWLAALALFVFALYELSSVMLPFVAALAIGYLLDPLADRFERWGMSRLVATLLILLIFVLATLAVAAIAAPVLARQLAAFIEAFPQLLVKLQTLASEQGAALLERYGLKIAERLGLDPAATGGEAQKAINEIVSQSGQWFIGVLKSLWSGGTALVGLASLLVVTPVVAFYVLLDWDHMVAAIDRNIPREHRDTVHAIARDIDRALAGFLRGQSLVCLFLGLWYGLGLTLIGLNYGLLIGVIGGALSFIPYVGSMLVFVLSLAVAIVQGWPGWTLPALAVAVVAAGQFLEGNVLTPRLVGQSVGLHPVWLMFALLAFGSLFGFTGLIVAVPVAAALGVLARHGLAVYRRSRLYLGPPPLSTPAPPEAP
jgi:predicted PurR-regulated permease PerM